MSVLSSPLRVALIGISGYGRVYLELARELRGRGEITIVAATVINAQEESANVAELTARGTKIFSDYREMLRQCAGQLDLCLIPTGINWHARMTIAALESGANVLVEKPLAGSVAEVAAIRDAERKAGRFVAVGFQDCYQPGTRWLRAELERGVIGELQSVRFLGVWPRSRQYFTRNNWAGRLRVEGVPVFDSPLNNAFSHFVMLSLFLVDGRETKVENAELWRAHAIESFDTGVVQARSERGVRLWLGATHASTSLVEPEIVVTGRDGQAHWRYQSEVWWQADDGSVARAPLTDINGARRAMFDAVVERLRAGRGRLCTAEMAGTHTALIEQIHQRADIAEVPREAIAAIGDEDSPNRLIQVRGLDEALRKSFSAECALSAAGFRFGAESAAVSLGI